MRHNTSAIARRCARTFAEVEECMETIIPDSLTAGLKTTSDTDDSSNDNGERPTVVEPSRSFTRDVQERRINPVVNLGRDVWDMFPSTREDIGKSIKMSLQAAQASDKKAEGRPLNFGTVLPKAIYRSSYPQVGDFQFLGTLGLKTIVTLVNKAIPVEFETFIRANSIRHVVIDLPGTKKTAIPEGIMYSIMEVILEQNNHPLLLHCNQGKHRTGCAIAVLRHVARWDVHSILEEYRGYAAPKIRDNDIKFITDYQLSDLEGLFNERPAVHTTKKAGCKLLRSLIGSLAIMLLIGFLVSAASSRRD